MSLRFSGNAIRVMQTCIKPLRRVWRGQLPGNGINYFVVKYIGVFWRGKVIITYAPILPALGHAIGNLFDASFGTRGAIRQRNTGFTEVLLRKYIGSNLAPGRRYLYVVHFKNGIA